MSRSLGCAAVLLLFAAALPTPGLAGGSVTLTQFGSGQNSTSLYFGSCQSTDNTTSVRLPYNANVSIASLTVSSPDDLTGVMGWVRIDVGDDGTVNRNRTLNASATSLSFNLTSSDWNAFIAAQNLSSGNVSVPLIVTSCPPAAGWNITLSSLSVTYSATVNSSENAPVFSGTIPGLNLKLNTSDPWAVYLPNYFSDADGDTLNYSLVKTNPSDPGWSNVSAPFNSSYLGFSASNGWTGNLTFRISATDPANQSASSNNVTLQVYPNRAPIFGGSANYTAIPNQTAPVNLYWNSFTWLGPYFTDPDFNDSISFAVVPENAGDPGWANVTANASTSYLVFTSSGDWLGDLTFRVRGTDGEGASALSNIVTLTIRPNEAPAFTGTVADFPVAVNGSAQARTDYFSDVDRETLTLSFVKGDPNATGWSFVNVTGYNGSSDLAGYLYVYASGGFSGNLSGKLRARDGVGNTVDSNTFTIVVNAPPASTGAGNGTILVYLIQGTTNYTAIEVTDYVWDPEGDPFTITAWISCCSSNNSSLPVGVVVNGTHLDFVSLNPTFTGVAQGYASACDGWGRCVYTVDFLIVVIVQPNRAPLFSGSLPDVNVTIGSLNRTLNLASHWTDADNDGLTIGYVKADPNATLWLYTTVTLQGWVVEVRAATNALVGDLVIAFYAFDPSYEWAWSNNVTIHIQERERAPIFFGPIANLTIAVGGTLTDAFDAADYFGDPNGYALSFSASNLSSSEGWNYTSLSWNGSRLSVANDGLSPWTGTICFRVRADDVNGTRSFSNDICIEIVSPPANAPPRPTDALPELTIPSGDDSPFVIDLALFFTDDAFPQLLEFDVVEGPEPEWADVDIAVNGTLLTITFLDAVPPAALTFEVVVTDAWGSTYTSAPAAITIEANPLNHAPQVDGPGPVTLEIGRLAFVQLQGFDSDNDALSWEFFPSTTGLVFSFDAPTERLSLTAQSLADGATADVLVRVSDGWGSRAETTLRITVWDPAAIPQITLQLSATRAGDVWLNGTATVGFQPPTSPSPSVRFSLDGGGSLFAPVVAGQFALRYPLSLTPGEHIVVASVLDGYGRFNEVRATLTVPEPIPDVPAITGIALNGLPPGDVDFGDTLTFGLLTSAPIPPAVTVSWYLDGVKVGEGSSFVTTVGEAGPHTIEARATNGVDERSFTTSFTVRQAPQAPVPPAVSGGNGLLVTGVLLSIAIVGAFVGLTESGRYFLLWALIGSVFARLKRESLLDHFVRGRLYQAISDTPGIHLAELRRRAKVGHGTAIHHLRVLEKGGYIRAVPSGSLTRFFPTEQALDDESYGLSDSDRAVLSVVASAPGISPSELSLKLEASPSTVSRSIGRLENLGYVTTEHKGRTSAVFPRPGAQGTDGAAPAWNEPGA